VSAAVDIRVVLFDLDDTLMAHSRAVDLAIALTQRAAGGDFAGEATRLAYMTDEAVEGRDAFLEKRAPDWSPYPWHY